MLRSQLLVYTCSDDEEDGGGGGGGGGAGGGGWVGGRERSLSQEIDSAMKKVLLPWERHSLERRGQNEMEMSGMSGMRGRVSVREPDFPGLEYSSRYAGQYSCT